MSLLRCFLALGSLSLLFHAGCMSEGADGSGVDTNGTTPKKVTQGLATLLPLEGCDAVEAYVRDRLTAEVDARIDAAEAALTDVAHCYSFGPSVDAGVAYASEGDTAGGAKTTSSTNNQVAGVDEADFVKNDGRYLYVAANGAFRIVEAYPATGARELAKVALDGEPRKLFVVGDRALVYVAVGGTPGGGGECAYGYECVPHGDGSRTKLVVLDVSDRAAPKKVREVELSGALLSARRTGNVVHTVVVQDTVRSAVALDAYPDLSGIDCGAQDGTRKARARAAWEKLRAESHAKIASTPVLDTLPTITEDGKAAAPACTGYYRPSVGEATSFTSVVSLDMVAGGAPTTATVVSDPGVTYASGTSLYLAVPRAHAADRDWYQALPSEGEATLVHGFRIGESPALTGYAASGLVKGRVLNPFSLDEHDGHLRIATSSGHLPDPATHSTVTVLAQQGASLVATGAVDHLAPSEDIRSVRFDGDRGYVVTFKKTDPLFVLDLGNPAAPAVTGELKIPGFSTYMHLLDAQHLLTIGYDADDQGDFAWFAGVLLQIFDVSDMKNPKLLHKQVIGTRGSSSEALADHLAFTWYAPKNVLALPMTICEGGDGGSYGSNMTFNGLVVYDVSVASGFHERGRVSHPNATSGNGYDSGACSQWWANAGTEVKRSVFFDDVVYSISKTRAKANGLGALATDIATVSLAD